MEWAVLINSISQLDNVFLNLYLNTHPYVTIFGQSMVASPSSCNIPVIYNGNGVMVAADLI